MNIERRRFFSALQTTLFAGCALSLGSLAQAQHYDETDLVSDLPGLAAVQDTHLANPWGLA
jgi:hypothetical protein